MKAKLITVVCASLLLVGLAGCDKKTDATNPQQGQNPQTNHESNTKVVLSKNMKKCSLADAATDGSLDAQKGKKMLRSYSKKNGCTESTALLNNNYKQAYHDALYHMHHAG